MIVTIDGPAGTGKSTVARAVAQRLGFDFLDTGAMYRAIGLEALRRGADLSDPRELAFIANHCRIEFDWSHSPPAVLLNGEVVTHLLRSGEATRAASFVATVPAIRQRLVEQQRQIGEEHGGATKGETESDEATKRRSDEGAGARGRPAVASDTPRPRGPSEQLMPNEQATERRSDEATKGPERGSVTPLPPEAGEVPSEVALATEARRRGSEPAVHEAQRLSRGLVTEGRDQGSVVFPHADFKFYLDADPAERARRRARQLRERGEIVDERAIYEEMLDRDRRDTGRAVAPLIVPPDAIRIDTTGMSQEEVIERIVGRVTDPR